MRTIVYSTVQRKREYINIHIDDHMQGFYDTMIAISCYIQECAACSPVPAELELFYCFIQGLCSDLPRETILHCSSGSALTNDTMQHCGLHSALLNDTCTAYIVAYILFYHVFLYLIILFVTDFSYVFC